MYIVVLHGDYFHLKSSRNISFVTFRKNQYNVIYHHNFPLVNISTDTSYVVVHMTLPILMWNHYVNVNALQIRYMYMYIVILFPLRWTIWTREAGCCVHCMDFCGIVYLFFIPFANLI